MQSGLCIPKHQKKKAQPYNTDIYQEKKKTHSQMNCNKRKKKVRQNNSLDTKSRIVIKKKKKKRQLDKKSRVDIKKKKYVYKIQNICIYKKTNVI